MSSSSNSSSEEQQQRSGIILDIHDAVKTIQRIRNNIDTDNNNKTDRKRARPDDESEIPVFRCRGGRCGQEMIYRDQRMRNDYDTLKDCEQKCVGAEDPRVSIVADRKNKNIPESVGRLISEFLLSPPFDGEYNIGNSYAARDRKLARDQMDLMNAMSSLEERLAELKGSLGSLRKEFRGDLKKKLKEASEELKRVEEERVALDVAESERLDRFLGRFLGTLTVTTLGNALTNYPDEPWLGVGEVKDGELKARAAARGGSALEIFEYGTQGTTLAGPFFAIGFKGVVRVVLRLGYDQFAVVIDGDVEAHIGEVILLSSSRTIARYVFEGTYDFYNGGRGRLIGVSVVSSSVAMGLSSIKITVWEMYKANAVQTVVETEGVPTSQVVNRNLRFIGDKMYFIVRLYNDSKELVAHDYKTGSRIQYDIPFGQFDGAPSLLRLPSEEILMYTKEHLNTRFKFAVFNPRNAGGDMTQRMVTRDRSVDEAFDIRLVFAGYDDWALHVYGDVFRR